MGLKSGHYQRTSGEMQSLVFKWKIVLLTDSFLFYMKPALISILLPKSMVSFTFDCFGLCFFPIKISEKFPQISEKFSQLTKSFTCRHKYIYEICHGREPEAGLCYLHIFIKEQLFQLFSSP